MSLARVNINGPQRMDYERFSLIDSAFSAPFVRIKSIARGATAEELGYLASGRNDGVVAINQQPYDIAAGVVIAQRAGAAVLDFNGFEWNVNTKDIIAASPVIAEKMLKRLRESVVF